MAGECQYERKETEDASRRQGDENAGPQTILNKETTAMQTHVIISYDGTDNDTDALALGRILGDAGTRVSLAYVRHTAETDPAAEQAAQEQAQELLERGAQWLGHPE